MIGCLILKFGGKNEPREWKVLSIQALLKPGDRWTPQKRNVHFLLDSDVGESTP